MYADIAALQVDPDFFNRTAACAATETIPDPGAWATDHSWQMAAAPGFGDAYASALAAGIPRPGLDPAVISDPQILSAVQTLTTP